MPPCALAILAPLAQCRWAWAVGASAARWQYRAGLFDLLEVIWGRWRTPARWCFRNCLWRRCRSWSRTEVRSFRRRCWWNPAKTSGRGIRWGADGPIVSCSARRFRALCTNNPDWRVHRGFRSDCCSWSCFRQPEFPCWSWIPFPVPFWPARRLCGCRPSPLRPRCHFSH